MTKYLILTAILVLLYLYWKQQQNKTIPHNPDDIIERKGKVKSETFWDTNDWEINSANNNQHD